MNKLAPPFRYGIYAGIGAVLYVFIFYLFDKKLFFHYGVYWSSLTFFILFVIKSQMDLITIGGERPPLDDLIRSGLIVYLIGSAIFWIFYYLLFQVDPNLEEVYKEAQVDMLRRSADWLYEGNVSQADLEKIIQDTRMSTGHGSLFTVFKSFAFSLIGGAMISIVTGLIVRRRQIH